MEVAVEVVTHVAALKEPVDDDSSKAHFRQQVKSSFLRMIPDGTLRDEEIN